VECRWEPGRLRGQAAEIGMQGFSVGGPTASRDPACQERAGRIPGTRLLEE